MRNIGIATVVLALMAGDASAQTPRGTFTLRNSNGGRRVVVQDPAPEPAQQVYPVYPSFPVAYTLLPAIVMSDGSVFANFGYGYVQVSRACGVSTPRVLDGRGFQTSPRGLQPAPSEPTASEQNLPSVQARRRAAERAAHGACYGQDSYGRVVVIR